MPDITKEDISVETFELGDWLTGATYHGKEVEIFRDGDRLTEMAELLELVERQTAAVAEQKRNLIGQDKSITDADPQDIIDEAQARADEILESMRGTGMTFRLRGISPGERAVLEQKIARGFKPKPAKYEVIDGQKLEVEPATQGGTHHPEFSKAFAFALLSKCIVSVTVGGNHVADTFTPEQIENIRNTVLLPEYNRLSNALYDVNHAAYNIDSKVTVDF